MNSENLYLRIRLFHRAGDTADESSTADGSDNDLDVGMLLQDLEAERSLPGDDSVIVEGMNERQRFLTARFDALFRRLRRSLRRATPRQRRKLVSQKLWSAAWAAA